MFWPKRITKIQIASLLIAKFVDEQSPYKMLVLSEMSPTEYDGFFSRYVNYIRGSESTDEALLKSERDVVSHYQGLSQEQLHYAYHPGKWTPKQILRHLIDTERIMAYRALRFSRNDKTALAGFEQDDYVWNSHANEESINDLLAEYQAVRLSTRLLFKSMSLQESERRGQSSSITLSARAFAFIIAGHDRHHLKVLAEKYLG